MPVIVISSLRGWILVLALFEMCSQPCDLVTTMHDGCVGCQIERSILLQVTDILIWFIHIAKYSCM